VFKILGNIKNIFVHIRSSLKLIFLIIISLAVIIGVISIFYKPTYSVTLNGEFVGYTSNKNVLQKRINEYMEKGEGGNTAFVDVEALPEYSLCFLKREAEMNDDEILEKVKNLGTTYYTYYAIVEEDKEKYYVSTKEEAEDILKQLEEKNSSNIKKLAYTQIYGTELKEFEESEEIVKALYKKKVYAPVYYGSAVATSKIDLSQFGVNLIKPVTSGYTITSRFGQRASGNHKGLDIAAPTGTNIVASAAGTVILSGNYNDGYGNYIIIDHGNGVKTLYAHCSKLYVSVGQYVAQGESIGAVGNTGNSTGPHLHLEVIVNGLKYNPQYYVY